MIKFILLYSVFSHRYVLVILPSILMCLKLLSNIYVYSMACDYSITLLYKPQTCIHEFFRLAYSICKSHTLYSHQLPNFFRKSHAVTWIIPFYNFQNTFYWNHWYQRKNKIIILQRHHTITTFLSTVWTSHSMLTECQLTKFQGYYNGTTVEGSQNNVDRSSKLVSLNMHFI